MPGLSSICRRIDKHGIELANKGILDTRRDTIEIDLLVGNDLSFSRANNKLGYES